MPTCVNANGVMACRNLRGIRTKAAEHEHGRVVAGGVPLLRADRACNSYVAGAVSREPDDIRADWTRVALVAFISGLPRCSWVAWVAFRSWQSRQSGSAVRPTGSEHIPPRRRRLTADIGNKRDERRAGIKHHIAGRVHRRLRPGASPIESVTAGDASSYRLRG